MSVRCARRRLYRLGRRIEPSVRDVLPRRGAEQHRLLRHQAYVAAQRLKAQVLDVVAVEQDLARLRLVEAGYEVDERCLARAAAPHERDDLTRLGAQADVVQHGGSSGVGKRDIPELDAPAHPRQRQRAGPLQHLRLGVEHLEDALRRAEGLR